MPRDVTESALIGIWELGDGPRASRRALAILSAAMPGTPDDVLGSVPVGARETAILALRRRLFGDRFTGVTDCPRCGESLELTFAIDDLRPAETSADEVRIQRNEMELLIDAEAPRTYELTRGECIVTFRLPNTLDLAAIERLVSVGAARDVLPEEVASAIGRAMAAEDPAADLTISVACPGCTFSWLEPFDAAAYLWTEVEASVLHLLADVHRMALAYGWSEADILALSPARRRAYLELLP